jgi:hypothetical protein
MKESEMGFLSSLPVVSLFNTLTGKTQASADRTAAQMQSNAADSAAQNTMKMFNQTRDDLQPYTQTGSLGNDQLAQGMRDGSLTHAFNLGDFHADPGYQFAGW